MHNNYFVCQTFSQNNNFKLNSEIKTTIVINKIFTYIRCIRLLKRDEKEDIFHGKSVFLFRKSFSFTNGD